MKRSIALAALAVSSFTLVVAQTPAAPLPADPGSAPTTAPAPSGSTVTPTGSSKIAVIAFQAAVGATNEFQRNLAELQKKWAPRQQKIKTDGDAVDNEAKQLQTQSATLSEAERTSRAKAIEDKRKTLERSFEDARNDYQQELQTLYNNTATKVFDVMASIAEKNGYTLVLDANSEQSSILYAIETTNITKDVVDAYNVKSGVAAPAQPAAAAPITPRPAAPRPATSKPATPQP
jgi:outer membrane protein